jgi:mannose-6-phosphate isomerase-like protein (cupin superfamily)
LRLRLVPILALLLGCAGPPAVVDAGLEPRLTVPLDELPARARLAADQDFRVVLLGRDAHSSHHIVAIRHGETLHRHDRHDLLVVMVEGHGTLQLGDELRTVGEGSVLYVPRGTRHAFTNASDAPATAYAIYMPAFDGKDRVEAE